LNSEKKFVRLHEACCRSLEVFYKTSQQTLNVLVLAEFFPADTGKRMALDFHLKAEMRAKQSYERKRRDLSEFIKARVKASTEKKAARKRRPKGS
jgi:hypothetical protein